MINEIKKQARASVQELIEIAQLKPGQLVVVGCSSSEVIGETIGTYSSPEVGEALFESIQTTLSEHGLYLVTQCCEHLNRALVIERAAAPHVDEVNVVPVPKAGGSFATAAYHGFKDPIVVEEMACHAGIDIGMTLIGMHLKRVAVPIRLTNNQIGKASINAARVRPKSIGGERAHYNELLK